MYELVKNENFYVVKGWMVNDLKLKGNEKTVFAVIYGFSQDGESWFEGSRDYLANWCNCTSTGLDKNIKSLLEKELIIKKTIGKGRVFHCRRWSCCSASCRCDRAWSPYNPSCRRCCCFRSRSRWRIGSSIRRTRRCRAARS